MPPVDGSPAREREAAELAALLQRLHGRPYGAYRELERGMWRLAPGLVLEVVHAQPDPFAPMSRVRVYARPPFVALPPSFTAGGPRQLAVEDTLLRALEEGAAQRHLREVVLPRLGPEMRWRSALQCLAGSGGGAVRVRLGLSLPALAGRRVDGQRTARLVLEELPRLLADVLRPPGRPEARLDAAMEAASIHEEVRLLLEERGLVAFVAEGSVLPRVSGTSQDPLPVPPAQPLRVEAADPLAVELFLSGGGRLRGLGIPKGVTVLVGGGYHGKSTLLDALARGVHPHPPGDGRERVVTHAMCAMVRAEDGRSVSFVDISPFVVGLPGGVDSSTFCTPKASGSTSQAAAVVEALEAGARVLLMDEDTSAANFLARDARMERLVPSDEEPIRPFLRRVRALARRGISTVLVAGSSGAAFEVADTVLQMLRYQPRDVTARARQVAGDARLQEGEDPFSALRARVVTEAFWRPVAADPRHVRVKGDDLQVGRDRWVEAGRLPQVFEPGELHGIAAALRTAARTRSRWPVGELARWLREELLPRGLEALDGEGWERTLPRSLEVLAVLNRVPDLAAQPESPLRTWEP